MVDISIVDTFIIDVSVLDVIMADTSVVDTIIIDIIRYQCRRYSSLSIPLLSMSVLGDIICWRHQHGRYRHYRCSVLLISLWLTPVLSISLVIIAIVTAVVVFVNCVVIIDKSAWELRGGDIVTCRSGMQQRNELLWPPTQCVIVWQRMVPVCCLRLHCLAWGPVIAWWIFAPWQWWFQP